MNQYKEYEEYLEENGIRPSSQRILMLEYLSNTDAHPTADMIYTDLTRALPTISKATVYNNLKLFVAKGIVNPLHVFKGQVNYDIVKRRHGHLICKDCNGIFDIHTEDLNLDLNQSNHDIEEVEIIARGTCNDCSSKASN